MVEGNGERSSGVEEEMAGFGAFRADGGGGCNFGAGSAIIRAAGSLLGADYDAGDHAIIAGCGIHCFMAAISRNGAGSGSGRDCGELLRAASACIWCLRVHPGIAPRRGSIGSTWVSVRGRYLGDCGVDPTDRSYMANRISSVRRSLHRDWRGANIGVGMAGEGSHIITGFSLFTLKVVLSGRGDEIIDRQGPISSANSLAPLFQSKRMPDACLTIAPTR